MKRAAILGILKTKDDTLGDTVMITDFSVPLHEQKTNFRALQLTGVCEQGELAEIYEVFTTGGSKRHRFTHTPGVGSRMIIPDVVDGLTSLNEAGLIDFILGLREKGIEIQLKRGVKHRKVKDDKKTKILVPFSADHEAVREAIRAAIAEHDLAADDEAEADEAAKAKAKEDDEKAAKAKADDSDKDPVEFDLQTADADAIAAHLVELGIEHAPEIIELPIEALRATASTLIEDNQE